MWGQPGATGVTKDITLDALASGSARMGVYADLGEYWDEEHIVIAKIESGTAPTAGGNIDVFAAYSRDASEWPAGVSGADAAWPADGNEDEWARQLGNPIISVIATNDTNTLQVQNARVFRPRARYMAIVVDNNWDQAIRNETTDTDNDSRVIVIPRRFLVQDAA